MIIPPGPPVGPAPLLFFYTHLHDAIRSELDSLSGAVLQLEGEKGGVEQIANQLTRLRSRYRFLEQVYKYHSSVEDEVGAVFLFNSS
jgi:zinc finger-like protein